MSTYNSPRGLRDFPPGAMDICKNIIDAVAGAYKDYAFTPGDVGLHLNLLKY